MSNPFTRFLNQWSNNDRFAEFIVYWDQLEAIVIGVYRQKMSVAEATEKYTLVWPWLRVNYPEWEPLLRPYWQQTKSGGETAVAEKATALDPFKYLIDIVQPADICANWLTMQQLPAAREALNQYILDQST